MPVAHPGPYQRPKMESFAKSVDSKKLLIIFAKRSRCFTGFWIRFWMLKSISSSIFNISKPRTLMKKKVRCDQAPNFFFFAKPDPPTNPNFLKSFISLARSPVRCLLLPSPLAMVQGYVSSRRQRLLHQLTMFYSIFQIGHLLLLNYSVENSPELAIFRPSIT